MEPVVLTCTKCQKKMKLPPTHFGKKVKCTGCESMLVIGPNGELEKVLPPGDNTASQAAGKKPSTSQPAAAAGAAPTTKKPTQPPPANPAPGAKPATAKIEAKPPATVVAAEKPADTVAGAAGAKAHKEMKPAGKVVGKAEMKKIHEVRKEKPVVVKESLKEKLGSIKKVSAKDRMKALEQDAGTRRTMTMIVMGVLALGIGFVVWYIINQGGATTAPTIKPPDDLVVAKLEEVEKITINLPNGKSADVKIYRRNSDFMQFVEIPAGTYKAGLNGTDAARMESPSLEVKLEHFYIGRYEITCGQYRKFLEVLDKRALKKREAERDAVAYERRSPDYAKELRALASRINEKFYDHPLQPTTKSNHASKDREFGRRKDDDPLVGIDWWDAYAYQSWANGGDPMKGYLPTELEWEVAARGPLMYLFPWGETEKDFKPLYDKAKEGEKELNEVEFILRTYGNAGGEKKQAENVNPPPNGFGLVNAFGNASEMCWDRFASGLYEYAKDNNAALAFQPEPIQANLEKYRSTNNKRAVRMSNCGLDKTLANMRFTTRDGVDPSQQQATMSFRCVFYDRAPSYAKELEDLTKAREATNKLRFALKDAEHMATSTAADAKDMKDLLEGSPGDSGKQERANAAANAAAAAKAKLETLQAAYAIFTDDKKIPSISGELSSVKLDDADGCKRLFTKYVGESHAAPLLEVAKPEELVAYLRLNRWFAGETEAPVNNPE